MFRFLGKILGRFFLPSWWLPRLEPWKAEHDFAGGYLVYLRQKDSTMVLFLSGRRLMFAGERRDRLLHQQGLWVGALMLQPQSAKKFRDNWQGEYYGDQEGMGIAVSGYAESYVEAAEPSDLPDHARPLFDRLCRLSREACARAAKAQTSRERLSQLEAQWAASQVTHPLHAEPGLGGSPGPDQPPSSDIDDLRL